MKKDRPHGAPDGDQSIKVSVADPGIPPMGPIDPDISRAVFALYDGKKLGAEDVRDARLLCALWQIAANLHTFSKQSAVNTAYLIALFRNLDK